MSVRDNSRFRDAESDGDIETVLSVVTYVGSKSVFNSNAVRNQGGYPALDAFQQGQPKVVRLPSSTLGWWENNANFEISYTEEDIAEAFLGSNFISEQLVGPNYDPDIRDAILEKLDIDPATDEEGYREQLRDVAGIDEEDDEVADGTSSRVDDIQQEDRSILVQVANSFDDIDEFLDDRDIEQVTHAKQTDLAEFLADKENRVVSRKIETAEMGGDL